MSSAADLYGVNPDDSSTWGKYLPLVVPQDGQPLASLSGVPQKLRMVNPTNPLWIGEGDHPEDKQNPIANQAKAASAWGALRARIGNPLPAPDGATPGSDQDKKYQGTMTMAQISALLHQRYLGFPDESIRDNIINQEGLSPGQAVLHEVPSVAAAPKYVQGELARGAAGATVKWNNAATKQTSPYQPGGRPQTETYILDSLSPKFRAAAMAHEAVHSWAAPNFPAFEPDKGQSNVSSYNNLGEEPAPHFDPAGAYHDRRMLDSLKADQLATAYGGYPADWQKQSPWPMVKK